MTPASCHRHRTATVIASFQLGVLKPELKHVSIGLMRESDPTTLLDGCGGRGADTQMSECVCGGWQLQASAEPNVQDRGLGLGWRSGSVQPQVLYHQHAPCSWRPLPLPQGAQ